MWLEEEKRATLLTILHGWLWVGSRNRGIPFGEFKIGDSEGAVRVYRPPRRPGTPLTVQPSPTKHPPVVYFHCNESLHATISN